jgi:hypothetical protein
MEVMSMLLLSLVVVVLVALAAVDAEVVLEPPLLWPAGLRQTDSV